MAITRSNKIWQLFFLSVVLLISVWYLVTFIRTGSGFGGPVAASGPNDPVAYLDRITSVLGAVLYAIALVSTAVAIPTLLNAEKPHARRACVAAHWAMLAAFPLGTFVGLHGLWILLRKPKAGASLNGDNP